MIFCKNQKTAQRNVSAKVSTYNKTINTWFFCVLLDLSVLTSSLVRINPIIHSEPYFNYYLLISAPQSKSFSYANVYEQHHNPKSSWKQIIDDVRNPFLQHCLLTQQAQRYILTLAHMLVFFARMQKMFWTHQIQAGEKSLCQDSLNMAASHT